jgi:ketosteroid isomerase-like protein
MSAHGAHALIDRIATAINEHDLDSLTECFDEKIESEHPAHPARRFTGRDQIRKNWAQIFDGVPDLRAHLVRAASDGHTAWAEWEWTGRRRDGTPHHHRGVTVLGINGDRASWVRLYMEPVEQGGAPIDAAVRSSVAPVVRS